MIFILIKLAKYIIPVIRFNIKYITLIDPKRL